MAKFGKNTESGLAALLGDVAGSKQMRGKQRADLQLRLLERLGALSGALGGRSLVGRLEVTHGDEIQGLFRRPEGCVEVVRVLADELHGVRIVWGLGFGELATPLGERPTLMDGPCFHRAREALEKAKKEHGWLVALGFGDPWDPAVTSLFRLMDALRSRWTARQAVYARAARRLPRQKDVAKEFGVHPSVVSESLKAAAYEAVLEGERAAEQILASFTARETS